MFLTALNIDINTINTWQELFFEIQLAINNPRIALGLVMALTGVVVDNGTKGRKDYKFLKE